MNAKALPDTTALVVPAAPKLPPLAGDSPCARQTQATHHPTDLPDTTALVVLTAPKIPPLSGE